MTALNFPDAPTNGQVFDKWTWNGSVWVLTGGGGSGGGSSVLYSTGLTYPVATTGITPRPSNETITVATKSYAQNLQVSATLYVQGATGQALEISVLGPGSVVIKRTRIWWGANVPLSMSVSFAYVQAANAAGTYSVGLAYPGGTQSGIINNGGADQNFFTILAVPA